MLGISRPKSGDGLTTLNVADCPHSPSHDVYTKFNQCPNPDFQTVRTDELLVSNGCRIYIGLGDCIWWQGRFLLWTPMETMLDKSRSYQSGVHYDIKLKRVF